MSVNPYLYFRTGLTSLQNRPEDGNAPHQAPLGMRAVPRWNLPQRGMFVPSKERTHAVSVYPCSFCRQRKPGKLASAYWAWFNADGGRSAWKLRYCPACAAENLSALWARLRETDGTSDVFACVSCGSSAVEDSDPIYVTLYLPGKEPQEIALQLDSACAAKLRIPITTQGERLPDRGGVVRGPSPSTSAWDALGLAPE